MTFTNITSDNLTSVLKMPFVDIIENIITVFNIMVIIDIMYFSYASCHWQDFSLMCFSYIHSRPLS